VTVDWAMARQAGGFGFLLTFGVLSLLALLVWLIEVISHRVDASRAGTGDREKRPQR